jgi:hypothetical protein
VVVVDNADGLEPQKLAEEAEDTCCKVPVLRHLVTLTECCLVSWAELEVSLACGDDVHTL